MRASTSLLLLRSSGSSGGGRSSSWGPLTWLGVAWLRLTCHGCAGVARAVRVCGTRRPLLLGTWSCAVVVADGVPLWRASWPCVGAPRLVRSRGSRCSGQLSRRRGAFPHPGGFRPRIYCLGGSTCIVKITPNAPNLDHAKNSFSQALFFQNRILVQRKYLSYHLCHLVPFSDSRKQKKTYFFCGK